MVRIKGKKFLQCKLPEQCLSAVCLENSLRRRNSGKSTSDAAMEETKQQSVKSIQENLLEAYNTGFESSDSNGLYW